MNRKETKEFLIQERISEYIKLHNGGDNEEDKQYQLWIDRLNEIAPALARDFQEYMDWLAEHSGKEQEGLYLFGVRDGIQTAKDIAEMLCEP